MGFDKNIKGNKGEINSPKDYIETPPTVEPV